MSPGARGEMPVVVVTAAVIEERGRFFLTRRVLGSHLEGCWEFPGGKCEPGESPEACIRREIREELGSEIEVGREIYRTSHAYPGRHIELRFFACALRGAPRPLLGQEMRWVPRGDMHALEFPPADREFIERLTAEAPHDPGRGEL